MVYSVNDNTTQNYCEDWENTPRNLRMRVEEKVDAVMPLAKDQGLKDGSLIQFSWPSGATVP